MMLPAGGFSLPVLQGPGDPVPFGPATWELRQWLGLSIYVLLFLVFVVVVYRLAKPQVESETAEEPRQQKEPEAHQP